MAREVVLAEHVPELLRILQRSIDIAEGLKRSIPDDPETGYSSSDLAHHRDAMGVLEVNAPHPVHSASESIKDRWITYVAAYSQILSDEWDDDLLPTHLVSVSIDHDLIEESLLLADVLRDDLHAAQRRAAEAKATLRAVG